MGTVIRFTGITKHDLQPNVVLDGAPRDLKSVFIMGFDKDGDVYFASSNADGGDLMWLMESAKLHLLNVTTD